MITEPTFCGTYSCATEEQCDDCFMVDHLKECAWCTEYDHEERTLKVQHLPSDYPKEADELDPIIAGVDFSAELEFIADQEAKHGEERVPANE
jgi:hypothetical protein